MLCAPRALQMVTCGPTNGGIHSVPASMESTNRTPLSHGQASIARFEYGLGIHTSMSISRSGGSGIAISSTSEGKSRNSSNGNMSGYPTRILIQEQPRSGEGAVAFMLSQPSSGDILFVEEQSIFEEMQPQNELCA
jgi:hypothetical protein